MKYCKFLAILLCVLWTKLGETNGAETTNERQPVLHFYVKSKESGHNKNVSITESIGITSGDAITIVCTTKNVHMWDGRIDHGKRQSPIPGFSTPSTDQNYVQCFELEVEKNNTGKCIYLDTIEHMTLENFTNNTKTEERVAIVLKSCPNIIAEFENDSSQGKISIQKEIPEWLWNAENNSVVCHVDNPSRIQLKSVYCKNPSLCNMKRLCTVHNCPSSVLAIPPCEQGCNHQSMEVNYFSGQLQCEANGFLTHLNFIKDFYSKMCYFQPRGSLSACQVLDLQIPDADIFHGFPLQLSGRASKFVIIQEPEVQIILSNGHILRPRVHIVSNRTHYKNRPYFSFVINATANSNTKLIKIIGYRYDSNDPLIIRKRLNIKVGEAPKITGLPTEMNLHKSESSRTVLFRATGLPDPKFVLYFNGMLVFSKTDHRFNIFEAQNGHRYLKIYTINGSFSGVLEISASNIFGKHDCKIVIKETIRLTRTEAYVVAVVLAILLIFVPYGFVNAVFKICDRIRAKQSAV